MTQGRLLLCAALGWSSIGLTGGAVSPSTAAAADGPTVTMSAFVAWTALGRQLIVYVKVGSTAPDLTVTIDPIVVARDGFVRRLVPYFQYCASAESRCEPCPAGHRCYESRVLFEDDVQGRVELPLVAADGGGSTRVTVAVDLQRAPDSDGDGMPDGFETIFHLDDWYPDHGPDDDPDGDGLTNLEEYRRGTNPRARYFYYFAEASSGDREPGLDQCFTIVPLGRQFSLGSDVWVTLIGDDGRRYRGNAHSSCPVSRFDHAADRVVAAIFESSNPVHIERTATMGLLSSSVPQNQIATIAMEAPSTRWIFADGGTDGVLDTFYLFFNPGPHPTNVTMTYRGDDGRVLLRRGRTLAPGVRTTVWVNADDAALGRTPASVEIAASTPVLAERAWRFDPPGRTVTQTSSPGAVAPSARWIFPEVDGRPDLETSIVIANPSSREATVDVRLLYDGEAEHRAGAVIVRPGGRAVVPAHRLNGLSGRRASVELQSRDGLGVVAERALLGHDAYGPWRFASGGATDPGSGWKIEGLGQAPETVITNVGSTPATVDLGFGSLGSNEPFTKIVTIPARHRLVVPSPRFYDRLFVTGRPGGGREAELVVELVRRVEGDGTSRPRAAGAIAARQR